MFEKLVLPNGLRVIAYPKADSKIVSVLVLIRNGSDYESRDENGISHFLEHMVFKGTRHFPTARDISLTIEEVGGQLNAFTGQELVGFFVKLPALHIDLGLKILSNMLLRPRFEGKELKKEKGVVFSEINEEQDDAWNLLDSLCNRILYGDQASGRPILGTQDSVKKFRKSDLIRYMKHHYIATSSVICVAGKIPETGLSQKIMEYFGKFPRGLIPVKQPFHDEYRGPETLMVGKEREKSVFALIAKTPYRASHPKRYAANILATILGRGMSSRLFIKLREERGLCYRVSTAHDSQSDKSCLATFAGTEPQNVQEMLEMVLQEYKSLIANGVTPDELKRAQEYDIGTSTMSFENPFAMASYLGRQELLLDEIHDPESEYEKYRQVTTEDVREVAQEIFKPENFYLVSIGPLTDDQPFRKILEQF